MSRRRPPARPRPLAPLDGVDPVAVHLPRDPTTTVLEHLLARFPRSAAQTAALFEGRQIVDDDGAVTLPHAPCTGQSIWYHRPLPVEPPLPQDLPVLYEDEHLLAVDKPHGLPTTPGGAFVRQSALIVMRRRRGEDLLAPAHRLDRDTAGVLLLIRDPTVRAAVQRQFQERTVEKSYEAVAALGDRAFEQIPLSRSSRMEKVQGILQAREIDGPVNAVTQIQPLRAFQDDEGRWAELALHPGTGQTHQLRVHLSALGLPIRWDPLYPQVLPREPGDVSRPLQLLARTLRLRHPVTGEPLELTSGRRLETLPSG